MNRFVIIYVDKELSRVKRDRFFAETDDLGEAKKIWATRFNASGQKTFLAIALKKQAFNCLQNKKSS